MKKKISVSMEEELITEIEEKAKKGIFRNKSHLVEFAVNKLLREEK